MKGQENGGSQEPSMYLQRPSASTSQDVRHILTHIFRDIYTRDAIRQDTVKNLQVSKHGSDSYHERYVDSLQSVHEEWQRRMDEAAMLERHIMQAQARAMSADERELNRVSSSCDNYQQLRLPPGYSHFRSCLDTKLLQSHTLLTPDHYLTEEPNFAPPPRHDLLAPSVPQYARDTVASQQHSRANATDTLDQVMSGLGDDFTCVTSEDWCSEAGKSVASQEVKKPPPQPSWKNKMTRMDVEMEKQALEKMKSRMNYLLNRRHRSPSDIPGPNSLLHYRKLPPKPYHLPAPLPDPEPAPSVIFLASPKVVFFQDYTVNEVYEQYVTLKNVSTVLRPVRVLPPSTKFFSLGLGQFPCDCGLVAPGMTCRFSVRFSPDSFKDYEDEVVIETQSANAKLSVPLVAQRQRPVLTLPKKLDVGQCLVGGYSITQFVIKNVGGPARFCMLPRQVWPATNLKSVVKNGVASIPPFDVRPSLFELVPGQAGVIEVAFSPPKKGVFTEELTILCDNCHLQHLQITGIGDLAKVEVVSVEHGETFPLPGESNDAYAQHFIRFDDLNPYTYTERTVIVKNCSLVDQPFQWRVCRPVLLPLDHFKEDGQVATEYAATEVRRATDEDSVFSIHPPSGVLQADSTLDFKVTFAPPRLDDYQSVLQLLLLQVPLEGCTGSPPLSFQRHPISPKISLEVERNGNKPFLDSLTTPSTAGTATRDIMVNGSSTRVQNHEDDSSEDARTGDPCHEFKAPIFRDVVGVEIELKGRAVPVDIVFHPYIVCYPGNITLGMAAKRTFSMANHSFTTVTFQWEPFLENHIIEVEPPFGELDPGMVLDFELSLTGVKPGKIEHLLKCHLLNVEEPFLLPIEANVKGPEVIVEDSSVDFGLVRVNKTARKTITLFNKSHLPAKWSLRDRSVRPLKTADGLSVVSNTSALVAFMNPSGRLQSIVGKIDIPPVEEDEDTTSLTETEFTFIPEAGDLRPLERKEVVVSILPTEVKTLRRVLQLDVEDGDTSYISVYGVVQCPQVCLLKCELEVSLIYVGVVSETIATMLNQSPIATRFRWLEPEGDDAERCEVKVSPKEGVIEGRQELPITVSLYTDTMESITDLRIPCEVMGMDEPVVLSVNCDVGGLEVKLAILDHNLVDITRHDDEHLVMDFGEANKLEDEPYRFLQIQNLSGIPAPFSVFFENYGAPQDFPADAMRSFRMEPNPDGSPGKCRLRRTKHIGDPLSKTTAQERRELLQHLLNRDLGMALLPNRTSGHLEPFGNEIVEVAAYFNMWGQYLDKLVFKVGHRTEMVTKIAVKVGAVGCPLQFQMVANHPQQQQAIVRFGTQVCGTDPVSRLMRVNNLSPFDIRLDWREYNLVPSDEKLLDLVVSYCRPFPVRDARGKEIVPREPPSLMEASEDREDEGPPGTTTTELTYSSTQPVSSASTLASFLMPEDRPKIISLFLRSHDGQESSIPYKVEPRQLVIPAHGNTNLTVTFKPLPEKEMPDDLDCNSFALGYTSLDTPELLHSPGMVTRPEAFYSVPLRLEMAAKLKAARLTVEYGDDDLVFHAAMSDLLDGTALKEEVLRVTSVCLANNTETPLCFKVKLSLPFLLVDLDPSCTKDGDPIAQETEVRRLLPRCELKLKVAFKTTRDLQAIYAPPQSKTFPLSPLIPVEKVILKVTDSVSSAKSDEAHSAELKPKRSSTNLCECPEGDTDTEPTATVSEEILSIEVPKRTEPVDMIHFEDEMEIHYDNMTIQRLPLRATLAVPQLQVSHQHIDFGTCFVGQTRIKQIRLRNRTGSQSLWNVSIDAQIQGCHAGIFTMDPAEGLLAAHITHVSNSEQTINLSFKPTHSQVYHAMFVFTGILGEENQYLHVRGAGSYDGKHEAVLNV